MTQISLEHGLIHDQPSGPSTQIARRSGGAYPRHYAWVLVLAVLDIVFTTLVLSTGGKELNAIARWAIDHAGVLGMVAIKATTLTVVLMICEYLGRHRPQTGRRLVELALIAQSAAVGCGLIYLTQFSIVLLQWTYMQ